MSHLIDEMARDMKIYPYQGEESTLYKGRLVYSALVHWIRHITQDYSSNEISGKSKAYILRRATEELDAFVETIPEIKEWFYQEVDSLEDVIRDIRSKMLCAGELEEINDCEKVILPKYDEKTCGEGIVRVVGLCDTGRPLEHMGITRLYLDTRKEYVSTYDLSLEQFIEWLYKNAKWSECNNINEFELFDAGSTKPPYQSWTDKKIKSQKYHLGRLALYNGLYEYWLVKYDDGVWYSAHISEILIKQKEERRIILALRKLNSNSIEASYKHCGSVVILNLYCKLPVIDESYISTYCWPLRYALDKLDYVVPLKMWDQISCRLENDLGIILKEKY